MGNEERQGKKIIRKESGKCIERRIENKER